MTIFSVFRYIDKIITRNMYRHGKFLVGADRKISK